jgi:hypothetical protein
VVSDFSRLAARVQANPYSADFGRSLQNRMEQECRKACHLLTVTRDADLLREAIRSGTYEVAAYQVCQNNGDADHLKILLRFVRQFRPILPEPTETACCPFLRAVRATIYSFPTGEEARSALHPLERALLSSARDPQLSGSIGRILTSLLNAVPKTRADIRPVLSGLAAAVTPFLRWAQNASDEAWDSYGASTAAVAVLLAREYPGEVGVYLKAVLDTVPQEISSAPRSDPYRLSTIGVRLAAALAGGETARFAAFLPLALLHSKEDDDYTYQDWLQQGIGALKRFPDLTVPLAALFPSQPRRCLALLRQIGRATHFGSEILNPLGECCFSGSRTADSDDEDWQAVLGLDASNAPLVAEFWRARWLLGMPCNVPPGIRRILLDRSRRAAELSHLEALCKAGSATVAPGIPARRDNLRARLQSDSDRADCESEIRERLTHAVIEAQMAAAEQQATLCFRERLRQAVGTLPISFSMTPDLQNATLLSFTITQNRKPLLKLLRAVVSGEPNPFEHHPENVAFRQRLAALGADVDAWQDAARERVSIPGESGRSSQLVHLSLETDPLHVLQMGNYFGTCLSAGSGFNAFSTVANALEQNKRVLFVRDGSGRVLARKLIGINGEGAMVGFYTYCSLSETEGARGLRTAVRKYLTDFADRCRIPLGDTGTVPRLFCDDWYDDGVAAWDGGEDGEETGAPTESSPALCSKPKSRQKECRHSRL